MAISPRLSLARRTAGELRRREGRNLVAVGVYGSVARGTDRDFSDIDLCVVVRRKRAWIQPMFRDGVLVTPSQMSRREARDEVTGSGPWLCEKLGGWRSMRPLHDPVRFLARLVARAHRPTAAQFRSSARKDLIAMYEDYGKVLNAVAAGDAEDAREMSLWFTGVAGSALLDVERRAILSDHDMVREIRRSGAVGRDLIRLRYRSLSVRETGRLAARIWTGLVNGAVEQGVRLPPELTRSARGGPSRGRSAPSRSRGAE